MSILDFMKPISDEEILSKLSKLDILDKVNIIDKYSLSEDLKPTRSDILYYFENLSHQETINKIVNNYVDCIDFPNEQSYLDANFLLACKKNNLNDVKKYIKLGADPNSNVTVDHDYYSSTGILYKNTSINAPLLCMYNNHWYEHELTIIYLLEKHTGKFHNMDKFISLIIQDYPIMEYLITSDKYSYCALSIVAHIIERGYTSSLEYILPCIMKHEDMYSLVTYILEHGSDNKIRILLKYNEVINNDHIAKFIITQCKLRYIKLLLENNIKIPMSTLRCARKRSNRLLLSLIGYKLKLTKRIKI